MAGCGCGTKSLTNGTFDPNVSSDSDNILWTGGSHAGGATYSIIKASEPLEITGVRAPNILIFATNPCVVANSSLILDGLDAAGCVTGLVNCLTATAAATLVGTSYEVVTNGTFTGTWTSGSTGVSSLFCATTKTTEKLTAIVCGEPPVLANWSGYVYLQDLNSAPQSGSVSVVSGLDQITSDPNYRPAVGSKIELRQTALVGANAATILSAGYSYNKAGKATWVMNLDRPVTGITSTALPGENPCSDAIARPQKVADLVFTLKCGCDITAKLSDTASSAATFPRGNAYKPCDGEMAGCEKQAYCFVIVDKTAGANPSTYRGKIIL
jgi:hypothetical protein